MSRVEPAEARGDAPEDARVWQEELEVADPAVRVDDVPPPLETLLYAWQHTLVDVSPYVLPLVVAGMALRRGRGALNHDL